MLLEQEHISGFMMKTYRQKLKGFGGEERGEKREADIESSETGYSQTFN